MTITLTSDEALVLSEMLYRWEEAEAEEVSQPQHQGEQVALWNLSALLERVVSELFSPDYKGQVQEARARLAALD